MENDNVIEKFELKVPEPQVEKQSAVFISQPQRISGAAKLAGQQPVINKEYVAPEPEKLRAVSPKPRDPEPIVPGLRFEKPAQIYAAPVITIVSAPEPVGPVPVQKEEEPVLEMELIFKEEVPAEEEQPKLEQPKTEQQKSEHPRQDNQLPFPEDLPLIDEMEEQKRRATERINKLRNLSFNINGSDSNNEFETVPAYIRRNLELYNTVNNVENFYSSYTVKPDDNNKSQISSINTFLDGKKPD